MYVIDISHIVDNPPKPSGIGSVTDLLTLGAIRQSFEQKRCAC